MSKQTQGGQHRQVPSRFLSYRVYFQKGLFLMEDFGCFRKGDCCCYLWQCYNCCYCCYCHCCYYCSCCCFFVTVAVSVTGVSFSPLPETTAITTEVTVVFFAGRTNLKALLILLTQNITSQLPLPTTPMPAMLLIAMILTASLLMVVFRMPLLKLRTNYILFQKSFEENKRILSLQLFPSLFFFLFIFFVFCSFILSDVILI